MLSVAKNANNDSTELHFLQEKEVTYSEKSIPEQSF
jgi:hypothetical protein